MDTNGGWPITRFDAFLRRVERRLLIADDESYKTVGVRWYGKGAFLRDELIGLRILRKQQWIIAAGDVVYNKLFAWKGAFAVADESVAGHIVSDKFPTYEINREVVDPAFLAYYFEIPEIARQAFLLSKGAAAISKLTLNPPQFRDLTVPMPPLAIQQQIVETLQAIRTKVNDALSLRAVAGQTVETALGVTLEGVARYLSEKYRTAPLVELVEPSRGISYGVVQTGAPHPEGIPTLRAGDLRRFRVRPDYVKLVDPAIEARYRRTRLFGNEVLLRIRGGLGEVATCPESMIGGNVSREIAVIPLTPAVVPRFAMYLLAAPSSQSVMLGHRRGTSYLGINLKDVRSLRIPVPPTQVQAEVIAYCDNIRDKLEAAASAQMAASAELDALFPSALHKVFVRPGAGKIR